jgi:serine/threonine protein kinase
MCIYTYVSNVQVSKTDTGTRRWYLNFQTALEAREAKRDIEVLWKSNKLPAMFDPTKFICLTKNELRSRMMDYACELVRRLKNLAEASENWCMTAEDAEREARRKYECYQAYLDLGSWENLCASHPGMVRFVPDANARGGGLIKLYSTPFDVASEVMIKRNVRDEKKWGDVYEWSVGQVTKVGSRIFVDFPEQKNWEGSIGDLMLAQPYSGLQGQGPGLELFDQHAFVQGVNVSNAEAPPRHVLKFTGIVAFRNPRAAEYGFVHAAQKLSPGAPYFEVRIESRHMNISLGLSAASFFAGKMAGSMPDSIGFHVQDRSVCFIEDGQPVCLPVPSCCFEERDRVGCGIIFEKEQPHAVYFTRNGTVLVRCALRETECGMLYPVVTGSRPAKIEFLGQVKHPEVGHACTLEVDTLEGKFLPRSKWKPVRRAGKQTREGIPVIFCDDPNGGDVVKLPPKRVKSIRQKMEWHELGRCCKYAFLYGEDGAKIQIHSGVHIIRDTIDVTRKSTISGKVAASGQDPPIILYSDRLVFSVQDSTQFSNLIIKSVGAKRNSHTGDACLTVTNGDLCIESCNISSTEGSGACTYKKFGHRPPGRLSIKSCVFVKCNMSAVFLGAYSGEAVLEKLWMQTIQKTCVACMEGTSVTLKGCIFDKCYRGIFSACAKSVEASLCEFSRCSESAVLHKTRDMRNDPPTHVTLRECKLQGNWVRTEGPGGNIVLEACTGARTNQGDGRFIKHVQPKAEHDHPGQGGNASVNDIEMKPEPVEALTPKAVLDSNHRLFEKLVTLWSPRVLVVLFKANFQAKAVKPWDSKWATEVLEGSLCHLAYAQKTCVRTKDIAMWDISLLCIFLLESPHYRLQNEELYKLAESVRYFRNLKAHSIEIQMSNESFLDKFPPLYKSLCGILEVIPQVYDSDPDAVEKCKTVEEELCTWHRNYVEKFRILDMKQTSSITWEDVVDEYGHIDFKRLLEGSYQVELENEQKYEVHVPGINRSDAFRARRVGDNRRLVLKVYKSTEVSHALNEACMLQKLKTVANDNILGYVDSFAHSRSFVVVTEFVEGDSLAEFIKIMHSTQLQQQDSQPPWMHAKWLMLQFAKGVSVMHDMHIVHRNLKPLNCRLVPHEDTFVLKILDFGLSKQVEKAANSNLTSMERIEKACSDVYMSPEMIEYEYRKKEVCEASDVWSMGVILHELLLGHTPFLPNQETPTRRVPIDRLIQHIKKGFTADHEKAVKQSLDNQGAESTKMIAVLRACLQTNPKQRYETAGKLLEALEEGAFETRQQADGEADTQHPPDAETQNDADVAQASDQSDESDREDDGETVRAGALKLLPSVCFYRTHEKACADKHASTCLFTMHAFLNVCFGKHVFMHVLINHSCTRLSMYIHRRQTAHCTWRVPEETLPRSSSSVRAKISAGM